MADSRQNWRKFQKILGFVPAKKQGLIVVGSGKKILSGISTSSCQDLPQKDFSHQGMLSEHLENSWEFFSHEYHAAGMTYIDRDELFTELASISSMKTGKISSDYYQEQLVALRNSLHLQRGEKSKLAAHFGDKPVENFWPRQHFLLQIFQSMFSELLPDRKILLLGIVEADNSLNAIALEFQGMELRKFMEPDWSNLEWNEKQTDYFHAETVNRFVLWSENHYILPSYALFVSRKVWDECRDMQVKQGNRAAWKHLMQWKKQKDSDVEVIVEPEPWPMKASLHWNSMKS